MAEIQIRAEVLRQPQIVAPPSPPLGFGPISGALGTGCSEGNVRKLWRERDLSRAIGAAEKAGLRSYRVEIAPDGTISIVVGAAPGGDAGCGRAARS